jgi:hypothetical protein
LQLDSIEDDAAGTTAPSDSGLKLPLFSLLAVEGGTGCMCAVPGTSIVAIAGKELGSSVWTVHLVDADALLPLISAPLLLPLSEPLVSASCIVALNVHAIDDGILHVAAAFALADGKVAWAQTTVSSNGVPLPRNAARASSVVFKQGNTVVEMPLMGDGNTALLLEDDGRVRVKQVVSNTLIGAALLEGDLLLAWRMR